MKNLHEFRWRGTFVQFLPDDNKPAVAIPWSMESPWQVGLVLDLGTLTFRRENEHWIDPKTQTVIPPPKDDSPRSERAVPIEPMKSNNRVLVERIATALRQYRVQEGHYPAGSQSDVARMLAGRVGPLMRVPLQWSPSGELLDSNGRPVVILFGDDWCLVGTTDESHQSLEEYVLFPPKSATHSSKK